MVRKELQRFSNRPRARSVVVGRYQAYQVDDHEEIIPSNIPYDAVTSVCTQRDEDG